MMINSEQELNRLQIFEQSPQCNNEEKVCVTKLMVSKYERPV